MIKNILNFTKYKPYSRVRSVIVRVLRLKLWHNKKFILALSGVVVLTMLVGSFVAYSQYQAQKYALDSATLKLLGKPIDKLSSKLNYDKKTNSYTYNPDAANGIKRADLGSPIDHTKVDPSELYGVALPKQPGKGFSYTDATTKLSFRLVPQFSGQSDGKVVDGRVVYPIENGRIVYSLKDNGLKEDVVVDKPVDSLTFSYKLDLPDSLEAKLMPGGRVGIYSADPALFGNISATANSDQNLIEKARKVNKKTHLVFEVPAPTILQTGSSVADSDLAQFTLRSNILTVKASELSKLTYPIAIDPSVVFVSANGFLDGNSDDNNSVIASGSVTRGNVTGGGLAAGWTTTTGFSGGRELFGTVISNGYIYVMGGWNGFTADLQDVQYAPINSDGTISAGAWQTTTNLPIALEGFGAVAYNGYIYVVGGLEYSSSTYYSSVMFAKQNGDGSIGAWNTTTSSSISGGREFLGLTAYNGYLYVVGGGNATAPLSDTQYAQIRADGSVGTWTSTSSLPAGRAGLQAVAYNGYLYSVAGHISGSDTTNVYFASINQDGSIDAWTATNNFITARQNPGVTVYNGYLYLVGGSSAGSSIDSFEYAEILADGEIGSWITGNYPTAIEALGVVAHGGYLYGLGGYKSTGTPQIFSTVYYGKIASPGTMTGWQATTSFSTSYSTGAGKNTVYYGVYGQATIAYHNCLFNLGGRLTGGASPPPTSSVIKATINADSTIGTWAATTGLPYGLYYQASFAYNNRIYVVGGVSASSGASTNVIMYSNVTYSTCALGAWTTNTTTFTGARSNLESVVYGGYVYVMGGTSGSTEYNDVQYAPIDYVTGAVGTFSSLPSFNNGRDSFYATVIDGYLYVIGGFNSSTTTYYSDVQFAELAATGGLVSGLSSCPGGGTLTNATWCSTTSMQTPRMGFSGYGYNGCIYAVAGNNAGSQLSSSEYACANGNGTLTSWVTGSSISSVRDYAGGAGARGALYIVGGETGGTAYMDVQDVYVQNGGNGVIGTASTTNSMSQARALAGVVIYNGYIYAAGGVGSTGSLTAGVEYAKVNDNGSLSAWAPTTSLTSAEYAFGMVAKNGFMYKVGGYGNGFHAESEYAPINSDGTLGAWISTTSLPIQTAGLGLVENNGFLYALGGHSSTDYNNVYYTTFIPGGGLNSWQSTTPFTTPRHDLSAVAYNDYIYVAGGQDSSANYLQDVQFAHINADGTLGSWTRTTDMPGARYDMGFTAYNGYLYGVGGRDSSFYYDSVWFAPINYNGTIGQWQESFTSSGSTMGTTLATDKGRMYIVGGGNGNGITSVYYARLNSQPRSSNYSLKLNLSSTIGGDQGGDPRLNRVSASGLGTINICSKGAAVSNLIYGGITCSTDLLNKDLQLLQYGRYVMLYVNLDDAHLATFPDNLGFHSQLTGFGFRLTPSADRRLRGGKTFTDLSNMTSNIPGTSIPQVQRLDTSGPAGSRSGIYMQTLTVASCPTTRTRVVDARDDHSYWIQKLSDGNCWMLTNLAYGGGGTNTYNDIKTLSNGSSDGSTIYTISKYYVPPGANPTTEPTDPSTSTGGTGQYGYLYNWCAAMGGQTGNGACSSTDATQPNTAINICPAGWRLPSSSEYTTLNSDINGGSTTSPSGLLYNWLGQYGGNYSSAFNNQGVYGFYWSGTVSSTNGANTLNYSSGSVVTAGPNNKDGGFSVRCVAAS